MKGHRKLILFIISLLVSFALITILLTSCCTCKNVCNNDAIVQNVELNCTNDQWKYVVTAIYIDPVDFSVKRLQLYTSRKYNVGDTIRLE